MLKLLTVRADGFDLRFGSVILLYSETGPALGLGSRSDAKGDPCQPLPCLLVGNSAIPSPGGSFPREVRAPSGLFYTSVLGYDGLNPKPSIPDMSW